MLCKSLEDTKLKITQTCCGSYAIHHQGEWSGSKLRCQTPTKHTTNIC